MRVVWDFSSSTPAFTGSSQPQQHLVASSPWRKAPVEHHVPPAELAHQVSAAGSSADISDVL